MDAAGTACGTRSRTHGCCGRPPCRAHASPREQLARCRCSGETVWTGRCDRSRPARSDPDRSASPPRRFRAELFSVIEFDRPDFPWLFTPEAPDASGRLQPWICLVVVPTAAALITTAPNLPLPVLECFLWEFQNFNEGWAWVQAMMVGGTRPVMSPR